MGDGDPNAWESSCEVRVRHGQIRSGVSVTFDERDVGSETDTVEGDTEGGAGDAAPGDDAMKPPEMGRVAAEREGRGPIKWSTEPVRFSSTIELPI